MPDKRDWLHHCNEFVVPNEDFELQHCGRCFQAECTRSLHGKGQFDHRVATWEERLFTETPKLDEGDPRVEVIRAKKFVEIGPAPEVGLSAWEDPRDLQDTSPEQAVVDLDEQGPAKAPELDDFPQEPQIQQQSTAPVMDRPMNTPAQSGQMVGGHDKPVQKPVVDPWEPKKEATLDGGQVVKPGARIRFGGSGV